MTLEAKLTALLESICPRTSPDIAPAETPRPYVTYQQIGGDVVYLLANELPSKENAQMQIEVWSDTRAEAKSMIKQIEAALIATAEFQARPVAACSSNYDSDMERYSSQQDWSIWCDR